MARADVKTQAGPVHRRGGVLCIDAAEKESKEQACQIGQWAALAANTNDNSETRGSMNHTTRNSATTILAVLPINPRNDRARDAFEPNFSHEARRGSHPNLLRARRGRESRLRENVNGV